jgi:hypothetical protein
MESRMTEVQKTLSGKDDVGKPGLIETMAFAMNGQSALAHRKLFGRPRFSIGGFLSWFAPTVIGFVALAFLVYDKEQSWTPEDARQAALIRAELVGQELPVRSFLEVKGGDLYLVTSVSNNVVTLHYKSLDSTTINLDLVTPEGERKPGASVLVGNHFFLRKVTRVVRPDNIEHPQLAVRYLAQLYKEK